jgi:hypothetical protein
MNDGRVFDYQRGRRPGQFVATELRCRSNRTRPRRSAGCTVSKVPLSVSSSQCNRYVPGASATPAPRLTRDIGSSAVVRTGHERGRLQLSGRGQARDRHREQATGRVVVPDVQTRTRQPTIERGGVPDLERESFGPAGPEVVHRTTGQRHRIGHRAWLQPARRVRAGPVSHRLQPAVLLPMDRVQAHQQSRVVNGSGRAGHQGDAPTQAPMGRTVEVHGGWAQRVRELVDVVLQAGGRPCGWPRRRRTRCRSPARSARTPPPCRCDRDRTQRRGTRPERPERWHAHGFGHPRSR